RRGAADRALDRRGRRAGAHRGRGSGHRHRSRGPGAHLRALRARGARQELRRAGVGVVDRPRDRELHWRPGVGGEPGWRGHLDHRGSAVGNVVLIVDDDEDMRDTYRDVLVLAGFRTLEAADARTALRILREGHDIGLVLLDLMMPGMSGWELHAELVA